MKPDSAVIFFTVVSGAGYGILITLSILMLKSEIFFYTNTKIIFSIASFCLIVSGLFSSTIHLGHPLRAWRALSQWKSSWLSREGVAAIFTFVPMLIFFYFWIFTELNYFKNLFIFLTGICSIITIFCTAKIYSSLKTIPAWNNPFVNIIYIINAIITGSIISFFILYFFNIDLFFLNNFIIIVSMLALLLKLSYWYSIKKNKTSDIGSATGLGKASKVDFFEGPHTGKNFLTSEMVNNLKKTKSLFLRFVFCIFTYIMPAYYIYNKNDIIISEHASLAVIIIIVCLSIIGMFIERWLFFIESKHTVSLYYGNKTV